MSKIFSSRGLWFALVLLLGTYLRFSAITWGIPTREFPHEPYHPDETWALHVLGYTNIPEGIFNPKEAHREGTLSYFVWLAVGYVAEKAGYLTRLPPFQLAGPSLAGDPATFLVLGRSVVAISDLLSSILVFLCVFTATRHFWASLLGMLVLLITPFEMVYAHFLRTHVMSNFMATATLAFTFYLVKSYRPTLSFLAAFCSGLGFATRYPTAVVGIAPLLACLNHELHKAFVIRKPLRSLVKVVTAPQLLVLPIGLALGAFIGVPFLFLDYPSAAPHLAQQATYMNASQFDASQLLDFSRVYAYLGYLIPYGMRPWLWTLSYASVVFLLFRPHLYRYTVPLFAFGFAYLYFMSKGFYATATFIRAAIGLFPVFAIAIGLAASSCSAFLLKRRWLRVPALGVTAAILVSTVVYDLAYLHAMKNDPRDQLLRYLADHYKGRSITIGLLPMRWNFFTTIPPLQGIIDPKVELLTHPVAQAVEGELHVATRFDSEDDETFSAGIARLEREHGYRKVAVFESPVSWMGITFDSSKNPHDLNYPIPSYVLLEKVAR
jgi:hypothetical protein